MNRKNPKTSLQAWDQAKHMIGPHHQKILDALKVLGTATYEEIALHVTMDKHQIGRRLKELEEQQKIYKPGTMKPTKTGRNAYLWCLTGEGQPKTDNEVRYKPGEKSLHEVANDLIEACKKPLPLTLF